MIWTERGGLNRLDHYDFAGIRTQASTVPDLSRDQDLTTRGIKIQGVSKCLAYFSVGKERIETS